MLACYPYVPIGGEMGMNCAVLTYNGTAYFGFTGDAHAIPDLQQFEKLLNQSFTELRKRLAGPAPRQKHAPAGREVAAAEAPAEPRAAVA
jgi:hypothetical protein